MNKRTFLSFVSAVLVSTGMYAQEANPTVISLEDALRIALSENVSVKVADKEIERAEYARKGTYASLFPQVDAVGSFQRTIKKQVMYMDFDMSAFSGMDSMGGDTPEDPESEVSATSSIPDSGGSSSGGGIEVGRWNTYSGGISAAMPLVNAQLWKGIQISGQEVELAVEKARSSRLDMVTQVKEAFYSVLLAKEALNVYKEVYDNAIANYGQTEKRHNAQKASDLELTRAKSAVSNAIPNVYNAESSVILALWQLKAVMGVDLDMDIDVAGALSDFGQSMLFDVNEADGMNLDYNTTMRQLAIQAEELANNVKMQKYAYLPSLAANFAYSVNAMTNDFNFKEYRWTPYSYIGLSISIPIFSGGKRLNDVRAAKVQYEELNLQKADAERQLKIGIRQYLNTMETRMKSYAAAQDAVETARKAYDIAQKSYNVGRSTITDLNDAQLVLTQSSLAVSQAVYNYVVAKSNLEKTIGHDFTDEEGNTDISAPYVLDK